ncbi:T9SS type A sorting domain-containing protein [bacterium SCSIO 12741]|nr:T9SS type A sorting domain-containing protein [bacterium SCSIO 12741]
MKTFPDIVIKRTALFSMLWLFSLPSFAQHWKSTGQWISPSILGRMYEDTATNHLYQAGENAVGGRLTGLFRFDERGQFERIDSSNEQSQGSDYVTSLMRYQGQLYIAGTFENIGSIQNKVKNFCTWDGNTFNQITIPTTDQNLFINHLFPYKNDMLLAGSFENVDGFKTRGLILWDGQDFKEFPNVISRSSFETMIETFVEYKGKYYVGGLFNTNHQNRNLQVLDSGEWQAIDGWEVTGLFGDVLTMKVYKGELYIGGTFHKNYGGIANCIVKYDGEHFYELGSGFDYPVHDLEIYNGKLYAFGRFNSVDSLQCPSRIASWDGERWCQFSSDTLSEHQIADGYFFNDTLYISGGFDQISGNNSLRTIAKWAGDYSTQNCTSNKAEIRRVGVYWTGVENDHAISENSWKFYPNPVSDQLLFTTVQAVEICVTDLSGRILIKKKMEPGEYTIDTSALPPGTYQVSSMNQKELLMKQ